MKYGEKKMVVNKIKKSQNRESIEQVEKCTLKKNKKSGKA